MSKFFLTALLAFSLVPSLTHCNDPEPTTKDLAIGTVVIVVGCVVIYKVGKKMFAITKNAYSGIKEKINQMKQPSQAEQLEKVLAQLEGIKLPLEEMAKALKILALLEVQKHQDNAKQTQPAH